MEVQFPLPTADPDGMTPPNGEPPRIDHVVAAPATGTANAGDQASYVEIGGGIEVRQDLLIAEVSAAGPPRDRGPGRDSPPKRRKRRRANRKG